MHKLVIRSMWATVGLALAVAFYLWLTMLSPFGYQAPGDAPGFEDEDRVHQVFVYGTLSRPWIRWIVMGRSGEQAPARLPGHSRHGLNILPTEGDSVDGYVVEVSAEELRRLDRYENLGVRYDRIEMVLESGDPAWVYRRIP